MTAGETSDEALMAAVRGGTVGLLGVLFERHAGLLRGFFRRRGFAGGGADDLVQEVFLRVLRYHASWRGEGAFAGWLWRFAANVANDALLRERRGNEIARAVAARVAGSGDPAAGQARIEEAATLHAALARLPADDRQLIEWR